MDPRLLRYYNRELQHVREMGGEFAREYPKIAGRLGLEGFECADPYVERLLEGFAFLAARVQLKLDAQYPVFTQHLLEMIYPHYLAPVPSMAVVQMQPDLKESGLLAGHTVARHTALRSLIGKDDRTACEYRTAHDVTLWPLEAVDAKYLETPAAIAAAGVALPAGKTVRAGLRLKFRVTAGAQAASGQINQNHDAGGIQRRAFDGDEALIPYSGRAFSGYRLLQEYFACPERFLFAEFTGLKSLLARSKGSEFEIVVLFDRSVASLHNAVDVSNFRLFCTPAINLFPRRADRIHLKQGATEYHILADRTRPMDFEEIGRAHV